MCRGYSKVWYVVDGVCVVGEVGRVIKIDWEIYWFGWEGYVEFFIVL